ncbi:hypothetical protein BDZ91DRAFT_770578 [Kalaharituber pfeilii]|nr:hypothetical protein BDZ91DRAFT_770578 [Kalaharituber pfeilii]
MSERPSTASTLRPGSANSTTVTLNRPATSGGGGGGSGSGRGTPPPNENKRVVTANASPRPKSKTDIQTPCRNIVIYGYCRYQDKGSFHQAPPFFLVTLRRNRQQTPNASESLRRKLNVDSPTFTPAKSTLAPKADAAPFTPSKFLQAVEPQAYQSLQQGFESLGLDSVGSPYRGQYRTDTSSPLKTAAAAGPMLGYTDYGVVPQVNPYAHNGSDLFYQQPSFTQPLQYHLYAPIGPHKQNLDANQRNIHHLFISDNLREELQRKSEASLQTLQNVGLPQVDAYHSLVPLDLSNQKSTQIFGYPSWIYKAFSSGDGKAYALRRVEGFRLRDPKDIMVVQRWKKVCNANMVTLYNAFTTTRFQDSSIIFVYAYHPLSKTLADEHFGPNPRYLPPRHPQGGPAVPETVLWSYMVQIASALRTIHQSGLAARVIDASKILLTTNGTRIRLNCCGMMDVIHPDTRSVQEHQQEDIVQFGRLVLCIACNTLAAAMNPHKSMEYISKYYSADLKNAIMYLMGVIQQPNVPPKSMDDFISKYAYAYLVNNLDSALQYDDTLESELCRELENGRLVRLLSKFGFINERPEFDHDRNWSESGDRYFIKLFRDYVFHSVDEHGMPVVDMAHVLSCLNKLDAGVDEKIMLVSRDEQNCFIVSYKEIKRAIDAAFMDLTKNQRR